MNAFRVYQRYSHFVDEVMGTVAAIVVGLDLFFVFAAVVLKPFGMGYAVFQEFPRLLQTVLVFLMVAGILKAKGHVNADFLIIRLKGRALAKVEIAILCLVVVSSVFLLTSALSVLEAQRTFREATTSEIEFPVWYITTTQVLGFWLLFLASIEMIIDRAILLSQKQPATPPADPMPGKG